MNDIKNKVVELVKKEVGKLLSIKINFELYGYYVIEDKDLHDVKSFNTKNEIVTSSTNISQLYDDFTAILDQKASEFQERDSGKKFYIE